MGTLATAPGVLGAALTTYVTVDDVMDLLGCKISNAYKTIRAVNEFARKNDKFAYDAGKASKYVFSDRFGIPMDVIDAVIEKNKERGRIGKKPQDRQQKGDDEHEKKDVQTTT